MIWLRYYQNQTADLIEMIFFLQKAYPWWDHFITLSLDDCHASESHKGLRLFLSHLSRMKSYTWIYKHINIHVHVNIHMQVWELTKRPHQLCQDLRFQPTKLPSSESSLPKLVLNSHSNHQVLCSPYRLLGFDRNWGYETFPSWMENTSEIQRKIYQAKDYTFQNR